METHCVQISAKVNIAWHTNSRYFPNHGVIQELKNHDAEISMSRDRKQQQNSQHGRTQLAQCTIQYRAPKLRLVLVITELG
jgi:hypothetical protein